MILVAAGILTNEQGEILIAERNGGGPFDGMWEFPGGKVKEIETPDQALARELAEEIGIELLELSPCLQFEHHYEDRSVDLHFFDVLSWRGEPHGKERQQLRWLSPADIAVETLIPADVPVVEFLIRRRKSQ